MNMFQYLALRREVQRKTVSLRKAFQFFPVARWQRGGMAQHHQRAVVRLHQLDVTEVA